jgi:hypothetical protein
MEKTATILYSSEWYLAGSKFSGLTASNLTVYKMSSGVRQLELGELNKPVLRTLVLSERQWIFVRHPYLPAKSQM